jgi:hypothetical protein
MAKKTTIEPTEEQIQEAAVVEETTQEETTQEVDPKLQGHPSRDFTTPINQG